MTGSDGTQSHKLQWNQLNQRLVTELGVSVEIYMGHPITASTVEDYDQIGRQLLLPSEVNAYLELSDFWEMFRSRSGLILEEHEPTRVYGDALSELTGLCNTVLADVRDDRHFIHAVSMQDDLRRFLVAILPAELFVETLTNFRDLVAAALRHRQLVWIE